MSAALPEVVMATVRGVPDTVAVRLDASFWITATRIDRGHYHPGSEVTDARPLLLLDPDDFEQCRALTDRLRDFPVGTHNAHRVRDALRSLLPKPEVPEPLGLGAVVRDAEGTLWTRAKAWGGTGSVSWVKCGVARGAAVWESWALLKGPVEVLSEGATS